MLKRRTHSKPALGSWTIMVYMVADEDDGVFTNEHIKKELKAIREPLRGTRAHRWPYKLTFAVRPSPGISSENGQLVDATIDQRPPGSIETIRRFIEFGLDKHPADHYLFIFWGHGFGPAGLKYGQFVLPAQLRKALRKGFGMFSTANRHGHVDVVSDEHDRAGIRVQPVASLAFYEGHQSHCRRRKVRSSRTSLFPTKRSFRLCRATGRIRRRLALESLTS